MYTVKRVIGGFAIFDEDQNIVGDVFSGTGSKAAAEAKAAELNGGPIVDIPDDEEGFERGGPREGRGA